jgi:DUF1680 family protein
MGRIHLLDRRQFMRITGTAMGVSMLPVSALAGNPQGPAVNSIGLVKNRGTGDVVPWKVKPFPMSQVRLLDGPFKRGMETNASYLRILPNDRLLHMFRLTAGLPSVAKPLGGKERPNCELRGHFSGGHYLSACALNYASTGDETLRRKADDLVAGLAVCQEAHDSGYLSAFPEEFFNRLRDGKQVWAPFYTLHKIMAGHLDMYVHCGNTQALATVEKMAGWVGRWIEPLSDTHMQRILEVEQGGILETLLNLYAATGNHEYLRTAERFDHHDFFDPLAEFRDELTGLHANTNIPKVIGAARQYEVTGNTRYRDIATYFWQEITSRRSFCTGGTSTNERWLSPAGSLGAEISQRSEECCCSYNMLKLTRHIFGWTASARAMDYYERTLFNSRLGTQDANGMKGYFLAVGRGWWKYYNTPFDSFWCCTGTGAEEFAKFNDTIYFHDGENLYVNLFMASELEWPEKGIWLRQETRFPEEDVTVLTVRTNRPTRMGIKVRVPYWATEGGYLTLNGAPLAASASPGSYVVVDRTWKSGDRLEVKLPMTWHAAPVDGDSTQQAMMYGPLVLAGRLSDEDLTHDMTYLGYSSDPPRRPYPVPDIMPVPGDPTGWIRPAGSRPLRFQTVAQPKNFEVTPLYQVSGERYVVYWKLFNPLSIAGQINENH